MSVDSTFGMKLTTREFARVFGVDFASVMFRGSQYKVESFMFRIAKPESFVLVSPSKEQVGLQNAPFAVPLIAEPESKYYNHPILVLDFQSLYPSVMIAYNICYSTCLGRVEKFKGTDKFGFTELKVADGLLELLKDYLTGESTLVSWSKVLNQVTPNGMIYVKPAVRKSLLAKMLGEILDTRVMVKHAMKGARGNKVGKDLWLTADRPVSALSTQRAAAWFETHGGEYWRLGPAIHLC